MRGEKAMARPKRNGMFALYRGDEFVDVGTADELAERHGIKPSSIAFMATPSYHRRKVGDRLLAYKIGGDE